MPEDEEKNHIKGKYFTYRERLQLEDLLATKHGVSDIARRMGKSRKTIYNEKARGLYEKYGKNLETVVAYSAEIAQKKYLKAIEGRGTDVKIAHDHKLARYLEDKIKIEKYSPETALKDIKRKGLKFDTKICVRTVYNYIDKGVLDIDNSDLPCRKDKKKKKEKADDRPKRVRIHKAAESIDDRPAEIDKREEFGHWEMDSVEGKRGESKHAFLVVTERKTRMEIIRIRTDHTAASVVRILDELERKLGDFFKTIFRSITVDNGIEFSDDVGIARSIYGGVRTKLYYCHPYSSWERATNEVGNRLVRRHVPKSTNFDDMTDEGAAYIENWMNDYPRRQFGFRSARELFDEEIAKLKAG